MSAWDVAGAVVWSLLSALIIHSFFNDGTNSQGKVFCLVVGVPIMFAAAYCIARLCGARE